MQTIPADDVFTEEEIHELLRETQESYDDVMPFVCGDCENIGGYYAASFGEISCPHCGGAAHPVNALKTVRRRPLV